MQRVQLMHVSPSTRTLRTAVTRPAASRCTSALIASTGQLSIYETSVLAPQTS